MALQKLAHADLRVNDLEAAVEFNIATMGFAEIARDAGRVYLGCGTGGNYDVALQEGGTGVARFALSADDDEDLTHHEGALARHGVPTERLSDPAPGVVKALRFRLPMGHVADIVTLDQRLHYDNPARKTGVKTGTGVPLGLDHITLRVGPDAKVTMDFMRTVLGFRSSDIVELPDGTTMATWMHISDQHHDVAMFIGSPEESLDHLAWTVGSLDHMKVMLDRFAREGVMTEAGPGRHAVGGNIYSYAWTPGGNRYELSGEMPRAVDRRAPALRWNPIERNIFSGWGAAVAGDGSEEPWAFSASTR